MDTKHRERQPQSRRNPAPATRRRTRPAKQEQTSPDVVYLPAQHFNRNRLILVLVTVAAVVVALLVGVSVFFNVDAEKYSVSGCDKYTPEQIWKAAGIRDGENLLTIGIPQAAAKIMKELPYIESVRIGIKLPDKVYIEVVESKVVYAVQTSDNAWWLLNSEGKVVDRAPDGVETNHTKLLGVQIQNPEAGQAAQAYEIGSTGTDENGNPLPVTVTQAQRLQTALDIVQYLEENGIIGLAASVDVTDMGNLEMWYGHQYRVKLGNDSQLLYKISCFKAFLSDPKTDPYEEGELDISFTTWPNQVGFTPFGDQN
ncbi:MAG: FtsQ-type POTRA domain-containing protein [Ruminococcaceae bacterium]|nr:FtsQ-type POTRA domain-containing protein [Oscillospiraceae bacterium]